MLKTLCLTIALSLPFFAHAGQLVWVSAQDITSYDYSYGDDCDKITLGTGGHQYTFTACAGQEIVKDSMNRMLLSPRSEQCLKSETCVGNRCTRFYGTRQATTRLLLIVNGDKIDSFKQKDDVGPCR